MNSKNTAADPLQLFAASANPNGKTSSALREQTPTMKNTARSYGLPRVHVHSWRGGALASMVEKGKLTGESVDEACEAVSQHKWRRYSGFYSSEAALRRLLQAQGLGGGVRA